MNYRHGKHSILLLRQHFSTADIRLCLPVLRQEPLVWQALIEDGLAGKAVEVLPPDPLEWTPAALALLEIEETVSLRNLRDPDWSALEPELHERANAALAGLQERDDLNGPLILTLESAGLAALALREQFVFNGGWTFLPELFSQINDYARPLAACLIGLAPDAMALVQSLLPTQPALAVHAFLCIPMELDNQTHALDEMLADLESQTKTAVLQALASGPGGRPELAKHLTVEPARPQDKGAAAQAGQQLSWSYSPAEVEVDLQNISHLQDAGRSFQAGGQPQAALEQYRLALQTSQKLQGYFLSQCAITYQEMAGEILAAPEQGTTIGSDDATEATSPEAETISTALLQAQDYTSAALQSWEQAQQLDPDQFAYDLQYVDYLIDQRRLDDAAAALKHLEEAALIAVETPEPSAIAEAPFSFWAASARLAAAQNHPETATDMLRRAIKRLDMLGSEPDSLAKEPVQAETLAKLAAAAFELRCYADVEKLLLRRLAVQPVDADALASLATAQLAQGKAAPALESAQVGFALQPNDSQLRLLIEALETAGEWALALDEHQTLIENTLQPTPAQYHHQATCANQAGLPELAVAACQKALEIDPQDGLAIAQLGEIALSESQPSQALEYFEQAVLLSPQIAQTWLDLAKWHTLHGQPEIALQTLQQAAQAAGDSAQVQAALGKAYLDDNSPSLALPPLRQAAALLQTLRPESLGWQCYRRLRTEITVALAKTLFQLGYLDESRLAFETVCSGDPYELGIDPRIAHNYAQILLAQGETDTALPWLNYASEKSANPKAHIALAKALMTYYDEESDPIASQTETITQPAQKAVDLLNEALQDPAALDALETAEAYALLAEACRSAGDLTGARDAYRKALDSSLAQQADWRFRLSFGLGKIALQLGEYETALAALLEARQANPTDSSVTRSLAETYQALDLPADVYQAARDTVSLDPQNPETLSWFAEQCLSLVNATSTGQAQPENSPLLGKSLSLTAAAVQALQQAVTLSPERADLIVRLAEVQALNGDRQAALETLDKLDVECCANWESGLLASRDLARAAGLLVKLAELPRAVELLERAVQLHTIEAPHGEEITYARLNFDYAQALYQVQDLPAGLAAIEQAIQSDPENVVYYLFKATLLLVAQDISSAIVCLETAQAKWPEAWDIDLRLALIHYEQADLSIASSHLQTACDLLHQQSPGSVEEGLCSWLAAELAYAVQNPLIDSTQPITFEAACLQAEDALRQSTLEAASENAVAALAPVVEIAPHHPRLLALQSRLLARQEGVSETSLQLFNTCLDDLGVDTDQEKPETGAESQTEPATQTPADNTTPSISGFLTTRIPRGLELYYQRILQAIASLSTLQGVFETALELKQWQPLEKLNHLLDSTGPQTPIKAILEARWLVQRAEMQHICAGLDIVQHAPGEKALSEAARESAERSLTLLTEQIELDTETAMVEITRWRLRAAACFAPDADQLEAFKIYAENNQMTVEDQAALIRLYSHLGQPQEAWVFGSALPLNPLISVVLGLVIQQSEPDRALSLVQQTLEQFSRPELALPDALPMLLALSARLRAAIPDRLPEALPVIQQALGIWPDEARWHDLAAELILQGSVSTSAELDEDAAAAPEGRRTADPVAEHLEIAARLEPNLADHHLKLGEYYAQKGDLVRALAAFEQAVTVEPDRAEAWLALAICQKETGKLDKSIASVERALAFTNQSLEALLLRAELALLNNNPRGAFSRAQTIINTAPDQADAWLIMAQALEMLDQPEDALKAVNQAIDCAKPEDDTAVIQDLRVRLIYRTQGAKTAIQAIQLLDQTDTDLAQHPFLNAQLADYALESGETNLSLQAARSALQSGQNSLPVETQAHLHYLIGAQTRRQGQLDQAIYHLSEAIRKSPTNFNAYLELGGAYQDRRQISQALEVYQIAAKRMPNDYRSYYQAGLALKESKDYLEAENMFRRAAHLAPNEVSVHRQLAAVVALNLVHNRRLATPD